MKLLSTEDAVMKMLVAARDHNRPAPTAYLLAAGLNEVSSNVLPVLERLAADGRAIPVGASVLPSGVEETPGDMRWALASDARQKAA